MKQITIEKSFLPDQAGTYLELPFEMPDYVERLEVSYKVFNKQAVVDLGLIDPDRLRGWSGGARDGFYIEYNHATPGYLAGELPCGNWAVLLGLYKIPADGCEVEVTVHMIPQSKKWLKGDLHTHTVHSDGKYILEDVVSIAAERDLDFIALTDHNTISQNVSYPRNTDVLFIPGLELTTNTGHCNVLGVKDPGIDFRYDSNIELEKGLRQAKEKGAKISLNHPHCSHCPWEWSFDMPYDWVEVWNGPWRAGNQRTLDWWNEQLLLGKKIIAIGGSDVHRPDPFVQHGMPTTWVFSDQKKIESILHAIDKGHVFMSFSPLGPTVDMKYGEYIIGDTATIKCHTQLVIQLRNLSKYDIVKIISDKGIELDKKVLAEDSLVETVSISTQRFVRVEVWRYFDEIKEHSLALLSNPIYFIENEINES
ncbi:CehA/McbA family metallohydrolase [Bacillus sp. UMB0893]|uniref:CehA/McbA family metallohydrolase n=1 Tax=Bacillus sp. UMB0893 TaxID=2066053 RepID=UPI000C786E3D|nr:CehA/McbA family metallohydrolase [Bacillus sp. UMB0893]PLR66260.1 phosphoesterase [Bacillus sp. UMB0893]